jgi:chloramphenicol-sensitive protein RarD
MVWSLLFLALVLWAAGRRAWIREALASRRTVAIYSGAAFLLTGNWWIYIWAVNAGFIVETSLGYFINPLVNVAFGVLFFHERLRGGQWVAIALAAAGVAYLTAVYGRPPWISLALAFSFAIYAALKKIAPLGAAEGLTLETAIMSLPAAAILVFWQAAGTASLGNVSRSVDLLLVGSGAATRLRRALRSPAFDRIPAHLGGPGDLRRRGRALQPASQPQFTTPGRQSVKGATRASNSSPEAVVIR